MGGWAIVPRAPVCTGEGSKGRREGHAVGGKEGIFGPCEGCGGWALVWEAPLSVGKGRKGAEEGAV